MGIEGGRRSLPTGFSLIEVVIVLVMIGFAVGLALPFAGSGLDTLQSAAAGRSVVRFLNMARIRAIQSASPVEVVYDFSKRTFIRKDTAEDNRAETHTLPKGTRVVAVESGGGETKDGEASVLFYPQGDSSGGTFLLVGSDEKKYRIHVGMLYGSPVLTRE